MLLAAQQVFDLNASRFEPLARIERDAAPGSTRMRHVLRERELIEADLGAGRAPTGRGHCLPLGVGGEMAERLVELVLGHRRESGALTYRGSAGVWTEHDPTVLEDLVDDILPGQLTAELYASAHGTSLARRHGVRDGSWEGGRGLGPPWQRERAP